MVKNRIYISGPITHDPDFKNHFLKAKRDIFEKMMNGEWKFSGVISPADVSAVLPSDFEHGEYMRVCFALLESAQAIYMLKDWKNSRGACMEFEFAVERGLEIYYEELPE